MLEQGTLLVLSGTGQSVYEKRGLVGVSYAPGGDGLWTPAAPAAPALARPVQLSQRYSAHRRTGGASAPMALSASEQRAIRRMYDAERERGQGGQKKPPLGWFLEI